MKVLAAAQFVHLLAVGDGANFETLFAEIADQQVAQAGIVIDDENVLALLFVHVLKDNHGFVNTSRQIVTAFCRPERGNILLHLSPLACGVWMDNYLHVTLVSPNMKLRIALSLLLASLLGSSMAWGQGYWRDLPPDERRQMRQQMREHWQQEREMRREDNAPARWRDLPPEDRQRMREEMRERHGGPDRRDNFGPGPGPGPGRGWRRD